jgi:outer membrane protein OmpA-like peptidoglycan-associated protein
LCTTLEKHIKAEQGATKKLLFMKKTIFILIAFIFCLNITTYSQKTRVGVTGGIDAANLSRTIGGADQDGEYRIGLIGGMQLEVPLGKKNKFSFQPDLHYIQKGAATTPNTPTLNRVYTALRYAELATNFVRNFNTKNGGAFYLGGGPYLGLPLQSKFVTHAAGTPNVLTDVSWGNAIANDLKGVDYGGDVVLGYRMKNGIFAALNYIQGARNLVPDDKLALAASADDKIKNIAFAVRVGYLFKSAPKVVVPVVLDRDKDGVPDNIDACPDVPGPAALQGCPDTDGDGILDKDDKCPTVKGIAKYQGCPIPDTDKDGINDEEDKCPTVPGLARYQGCPIPDTDKDGINDEEDKCPKVPGVARYQGCPVPDTDGDGVNDEEDKCVTIPGPKENFGCPVIPPEVKKRIDVAAKNILFVSGSSKLQASSYKGLNDVANIMKEYPGASLAIDGHTDNVGSDEMNQKLSEDRANSVKTYLVSKGVDESLITAAGHGETIPIADNKTAAGRQQNRRSELTLSYMK